MKKPSVFASLARLVAGIFTGLLGLACYLDASAEGLIPSFFFALMMALGLRWMILGGLGLARPLPPRPKTYGVALCVMLVLGLVGPTISSAYLKQKEPTCWNDVIASNSGETWRKGYILKIPEKFRRPQYLSRQCEALCSDALKEKNFKKLRYQAEQAFQAAPDQYDDQARKTISTDFAELLEVGLKALKPTKQADPKMTQAFRTVLKELADKPTRHLYFHFDAKGTLGKIAQDQQFLSHADPKVGKLPILEVGEAFSSQAHARRSGAVQGALQASLDAVWPKGLLDFTPAPKDPSPDDVHFWVEADVHRIPGFYTNTEKDVVTSLLYKCEVAWRFRIVVQGKEVGSFNLRSEPAKQVRYSTQKSDPDWAPYSIVMDSAADNFARLVLVRLGLTVPPARESYTFSK